MASTEEPDNSSGGLPSYLEDRCEPCLQTFRNTTIIRGTIAIVSIISSLILIWQLCGSRNRLTTTYHRILLGMACSDIIYSLSMATFNASAPSDVWYLVWNASGNQATCSAQGFFWALGGFSTILYSCSFNLYSLVIVKNQQASDAYIRTRVEPFLHGVPIAYALICSITLLAKENLNDGGGSCWEPIYNPPHCKGVDDGTVLEGFEIPCGRGRDGAVMFYYICFIITVLLAPVVVVVSLAWIFRIVRQHERKLESYGAASIQNKADEEVPERSLLERLGCGRKRSSSEPAKKSRAIRQRAVAYTTSYFLAWSFGIIGVILNMVGVNWPKALLYLVNIFNPLQGFFNLCIFMHPKVVRVKSQGRPSTWCRAIAKAFLSSRGQDRQSSCCPTMNCFGSIASNRQVDKRGSGHSGKTSMTLSSVSSTKLPEPGNEAEP